MSIFIDHPEFAPDDDGDDDYWDYGPDDWDPYAWYDCGYCHGTGELSDSVEGTVECPACEGFGGDYY